MASEKISTEAVLAADRAHVWHPMFQHKMLEDRQLMVITEAEGATVTDGRRRSSWGPFSSI